MRPIHIVDRRYYTRITPQYDLLDEQVARRYFIAVISEMQKKGDLYSRIWTIEEIWFPNVFLNVLDHQANPMFILSLNFRNYNFHPPQIGFLNLDWQTIKNFPPSVLIAKNIIPHAMGAWVCLPGSTEYHELYFDLDRWENERRNYDGNIVALISNIVDLFDRKTNNEVK